MSQTGDLSSKGDDDAGETLATSLDGLEGGVLSQGCLANTVSPFILEIKKFISDINGILDKELIVGKKIGQLNYSNLKELNWQGSFPSFLHKIGKLDSPNCRCGELGSPEHFVATRCSYSNIYVKMGTVETFLAYYKRIDNIRGLLAPLVFPCPGLLAGASLGGGFVVSGTPWLRRP
ncbi:hypothetical protein JTE90_002228 [Oedothorax gibbosus]|uniref:Uncharacterized protein n=1 Tax=Oedothorax gibbosus TaxID=931172 RepID=A0AAV6TRD9_9ARAC|nr:hypothetical protein JTE90_002228 [Oedothorax gibbosus]